MAAIAMATADLNDVSALSASHVNTTVSTTQARTGSYSYYNGTNGALAWTLIFPAKGEVYCRVASWVIASPIRLYFQSNAVTQCSVRFTTGQIQIYYRETTTQLAEITIPFSPSSWTVYEVYVKIHSTAGIVTVKVNGAQVLTVTNVNTRYTSDTINALAVYQGGSAAFYWDDLLVDDANWPGLGGIEVIRPDGDGTDQDWDSGTYEDVNTDNDATYVATDAEVAAKQSFTIPALASDRKTPKAVGLFTKSQLSGVGAGTLRPYLDTNQGQSLALSTSPQWTKDFQVAYPSEVGLEVIV